MLFRSVNFIKGMHDSPQVSRSLVVRVPMTYLREVHVIGSKTRAFFPFLLRSCHDLHIKLKCLNKLLASFEKNSINPYLFWL